MASASPSPTPNPNALKFDLDVQLPAMFTFGSEAEARADGNAFAAAVLGTEGVASVFGTASFVTVTRRPQAPWEPIVQAVQEAAREL